MITQTFYVKKCSVVNSFAVFSRQLFQKQTPTDTLKPLLPQMLGGDQKTNKDIL